MSFVIKIKRGMYRSIPVTNQVFNLVKGYTVGVKGNYVTVKNEGHFDTDIENVRIRVADPKCIEFLSSDTEVSSPEVVVHTPAVVETDTEIMNRISARFEILDEMSRACINGDIRAMIVTGPPGVGKSHGITVQMHKASLFDKIAQNKPRFEVVKGAVSGIGLYALLYQYADAKNVLVFDDCDVWSDPDALNILKGALDSNKVRRISWNKDSRKLRAEHIPNSFEFKGSIIFITNVDVTGHRLGGKIQAHIDALQSRCHYIDLTINTERDKMLRVRQVHRDADGGLFADYDFSAKQTREIFEYMEKNSTTLREVSMRMALKIADLVKINPKNWQTLANITCTTKG